MRKRGKSQRGGEEMGGGGRWRGGGEPLHLSWFVSTLL